MGQVKQMSLQARARKSGCLLLQRLDSGEEHELWALCLSCLTWKITSPVLALFCEVDDNRYFRGLWKSK